MLGEFDAATAKAHGLANWFVLRDQLGGEAMMVARKLSGAATRAIGGAKRLIRNSLPSSWDERPAREAE